MIEEEQQSSPSLDSAMDVWRIELEKDYSSSNNNINKDSKNDLSTEAIKGEEEGNKYLELNNQGDKEDAFDNLAVEFDKIKFAMLEYQHGVNHL
jgi:hypothetical protein